MTYESKADSLKELGRYDSALAAYEQAIQLGGNLAQCSTEFERGLPLRRTLSQNF